MDAVLFVTPEHNRSVPAESLTRLEHADLWAVISEMFLFLIFLASLGAALPLALQTPAGIILVGNEILSGKIEDANAVYLCRELRRLGMDVRKIAVIPDDVDVIAAEVAAAHRAWDVVFTSGGVGPTSATAQGPGPVSTASSSGDGASRPRASSYS